MLKRAVQTVVVVMVMVLVLGGSVQAEYASDVGTILKGVSEDMDILNSDIREYSEGDISYSRFVNRVKENRRVALGRLQLIISYEDKAPDEELHAEISSLVANWFLTLEFTERGVEESDSDLFLSSQKILEHVIYKTDKLMGRVRSLE